MEQCGSSEAQGTGRFKERRPLMLAVDTSTDVGTVGIGLSPYQCVESYFKIEKGHSGRLMPMIDSLFKKLFIEPEQIDLVIAGTGPGTFSGVKAGVTTAKSIAFGLKKDIVGVCSLDILVAPVRGDYDLILSVLDARRDMFYAASYRPLPGGPERVKGPVCFSADAAVRAVLEHNRERVLVVGDIESALLEALKKAGVERIESMEATPSARDMFMAGKQAAASGIPDPSTVEPIYLKNPT